jgi:hypothetical protein
MTASTSLSVFHQWLLAEPSSKTSACAITLHFDGQKSGGDLIVEVAAYLNEYDDDGDGRWLPATDELVTKISQDPNHRQLLGMDEVDENVDASAEFHKTMSALGQRGHVVFRAQAVINEDPDLANTFHAGIGKPREITHPCHIILNPALLDAKSIPPIIGDVFLEWLHCENRRDSSIRDIR